MVHVFMCTHRRPRSACVSAQSEQSIRVKQFFRTVIGLCSCADWYRHTMLGTCPYGPCYRQRSVKAVTDICPELSWKYHTDRRQFFCVSWVVLHTTNTPGMRQSKTLLTIDERGSKIDKNNVFDWHLSPGVEQNCTVDRHTPLIAYISRVFH